MAQPVKNSSSNRQVAQDSNSDNDNEDITASGANGRGGSSPGQAGKSPAVSTTSTPTGGHMANPAARQPSPTGKSGASGSQPAYAPAQTPSAREKALRASADLTRVAMQASDPLKALKTIFKNANEVRLVLPASFAPESKSDPYGQMCGRKWLKQLPIRHLDLRLAPTPDSKVQRIDQIVFVSRLISDLDDLANSGNSAPTVDLDLPMLPATMGFSAMDDMCVKNLYDALARSKIVVRVRVKDYQPEYDRLGCLVFDNEILASNKKITELELADCEFDDKAAGELAGALKANTSIKTLVLNNCSIPDAGSAALAKAFSQRPDLQVVGFDPGAAALAAPQGKQPGGSGGKAGKGSAGAVVATTGNGAKALAGNTASASTTTTTTTTPAANASGPATTSMTSRPPVNFQTMHSNARHEAELADSVAEAQAALKQDDPAPALRQLFNRRATVRIGVPAKILWKVDDANGVGDGYEQFSGVKCLSTLKLRNIEFHPQPCQAGETQSCQFDFLAYMLDSLGQLPKKGLIGTRLAIVAPDTGTAEEISGGTVRAQDSLFKSLARDRLTARLDLGSLAPRSEGSAALCRFFDSLPGKTHLVELRLCGAVLNRAETLALADGLRENQSLQVLDLTGALLDAGVQHRFDDAVRDRPDLKLVH